jgi:SSS family solute:Na+ symporter
MATIIYATIHTALVAIVDVNPSYTPFISILLMSLTILYTSMGGFKAVVATDVIQSIILWSGAFMTIIAVSIHFNSLVSWLPGQWLDHWTPLKWGVDANERLTVGNAMIMLSVWFICTNGSDQMAVQRYLSTKDVHAARRTFGVSLITTFVVKIFLAIVGVAMIAYFIENPHFLNDGQDIISESDQLFPKFILIGLPVGISGLVASGILAAAMSSLSSGLNSSSSVINEDILKRLAPRLVSANPLKQVKKISVFVGIIAMILSLAIGNVQGNLLDVVIKVVNLFVAPLFVLFFMAIFIPFATVRGTVLAGLVSVVMAVAAAFWEFMGIKVLLIMPFALVTGITAGIIASLIEGLISIGVKGRNNH